MRLSCGQSLSFAIGTKLEHNDYTGFEFEPDARLSWTLSSSQFAVGRRIARGAHPLAYRSRSQ